MTDYILPQLKRAQPIITAYISIQDVLDTFGNWLYIKGFINWANDINVSVDKDSAPVDNAVVSVLSCHGDLKRRLMAEGLKVTRNGILMSSLYQKITGITVHFESAKRNVLQVTISTDEWEKITNRRGL